MRFRRLRAAAGAAVTAVALVLAVGQAASAAPLCPVGPGWALALYSAAGMTHHSAADTLYLVDPAGRRYPVARIPDTDGSVRLIAWSGDGTRALAGLPGGAVEQIALDGGQVRRVSLPAGVTAVGYTRPDGLGILGESTSGGLTTLARYTLGGTLSRVLATWPSSAASAASVVFGAAALQAPSGTFLVVPGSAALRLVSSHGGVSGVLPLPVPRGASCAPVRWWRDDVVLAECSGPGGTAGPRLWLVPASGARPAALTPQRGQNGPDYGDINGWRLPGGALYLQALASCGPPFIARADRNGTVTPLLVPGVVVTQAGQWLLAEQAGGCLDSTSLLWFNPVTHAERWVFRTPAADFGVISAAAFAS